jgi:hypothetical protein
MKIEVNEHWSHTDDWVARVLVDGPVGHSYIHIERGSHYPDVSEGYFFFPGGWHHGRTPERIADCILGSGSRRFHRDPLIEAIRLLLTFAAVNG